MALYTKTGDDGTTGLFGGERVGKDHPRIEACGTVDELNAWLGLAAAACAAGGADSGPLRSILERLQHGLFDLGADLATPAGSPGRGSIATVSNERVEELERWIDEIDGGNDPLRAFVLPGGVEAAARLHAARTVCRRAERRLVNLARSGDVNPAARVYLNRLGDLLFAMARRANKDAGAPDVEWKKKPR